MTLGWRRPVEVVLGVEMKRRVGQVVLLAIGSRSSEAGPEFGAVGSIEVVAAGILGSVVGHSDQHRSDNTVVAGSRAVEAVDLARSQQVPDCMRVAEADIEVDSRGVLQQQTWHAGARADAAGSVAIHSHWPFVVAASPRSLKTRVCWAAGMASPAKGAEVAATAVRNCRLEDSHIRSVAFEVGRGA